MTFSFLCSIDPLLDNKDSICGYAPDYPKQPGRINDTVTDHAMGQSVFDYHNHD